MIELTFPKLTSYQQEAYDWFGDPYREAKTIVLKSVRQSGKTFWIQIELIKMAVSHKCVSAVYEPTLSLSRNVYKSIVKALEQTGLLASANAQLLEIELTNGSTILFRSPEQISRGLSVSGLLVLDECAYLDDEEIYSILPLANANNASIIIASTPFVQEGYFYEMYMKGLDNGYPLIKTFDWSKHPEIDRFLTPEKRELYRQIMSRAKYTTEICGDFLVDGGFLFQGLENVIGEPEKTDVVYLGIDFATGSENDYTTLACINSLGHLEEIHRTNNLTPSEQVQWLLSIIFDIAERKTIRTILAEVNSIGAVYIDWMRKDLAKKNLHITEWVTTNKTKNDLITTLQIGIEQGYIRILPEPNLLNELRKYQAEVNPKTKVITYGGYKCHDDLVICTALAYYAYKKGLGKIRIQIF